MDTSMSIEKNEVNLDCSALDKTEDDIKLNTSAIVDANNSNSAKKSREQLKLKREEEKKKKEAERLEALKKKEEEKERLRLEKLEEIKRKEAEKEKLRLEKVEEAKKKEEERRKKEEEKEKLKQEKLEKERLRLELQNAKNEEKKRKEEEKIKEEEEKRRKEDKVRQQFCKYFIKKDNQPTQKEEEEKNLRFLPFQIKQNMHIAPICRRIDFDEIKFDLKETLDNYLNNQNFNADYLKELKDRKIKPKSFPKTLQINRTSEDDCVELKNAISRFKIKYLHFDPKEYRRPPYYGTWRKQSKIIKPNNPFMKDTDILDYDIDSDEEWEDEGEGESVGKSGDEEDMSDDDEEEDDGFFVPHGYLSDDEIDEENRIEPELKKAHEEVRREQWENERKKASNLLITKCIGCIWDQSKVEIKELNKFKMAPLNFALPIPINQSNEKDKGDDDVIKTNKSKNINNSDQSSPSVKTKHKSKANTSQSPIVIQNAQSQSNTTPSIVKFISHSSNKRDKQASVAGLNDQTIHKAINGAEKRICSESEENNVKRLKLEDLNIKEGNLNESQMKKQEPETKVDGNQNKENEVLCITLE